MCRCVVRFAVPACRSSRETQLEHRYADFQQVFSNFDEILSFTKVCQNISVWLESDNNNALQRVAWRQLVKYLPELKTMRTNVVQENIELFAWSLLTFEITKQKGVSIIVTCYTQRLDLGTKWRWAVCFAPQGLHTLGQEAGWALDPASRLSFYWRSSPVTNGVSHDWLSWYLVYTSCHQRSPALFNRACSLPSTKRPCEFLTWSIKV